jgi:hypothetical protein
MTAQRIVEIYRERGFTLRPHQGRLRIAPKGKLEQTDNWLLRANKGKIVAFLLREQVTQGKFTVGYQQDPPECPTCHQRQVGITQWNHPFCQGCHQEIEAVDAWYHITPKQTASNGKS